MRSKVLVWGYLCVLSLATMLNLYMPKNEAVAKESIVIPGEAIRLRILANSDFEKDQKIKRKVRDAVNAKVELWVRDLTSMEKAREVIESKLPEIQEIAEKTVLEQGSDQSVKVEFRKVQFPTKLYGQFLYPAGKYQAILITLGKGEGANWWCVLYPPLCFLDFSNGVAVTSDGFEDSAMAATSEQEVMNEQVVEEAVQTPEEPAGDSESAVDKREAEETREVVEEEQPQTQAVDKSQSVEKSESHIETFDDAAISNDENPAVKSAPELEKEKPAVKSVTEITKEEPVTEPEKEESVEKPAVNFETSVEKEKAQQAPVYTKEDEQPVKVKFFVVELWEKLFN
ncbi:stage II sporulation protein R [Neobacillus kokaensis]|uniref:Stage II sporulation protein R n=1 Tax=Neobacillus kokaensis TaxID=2759023 RepID=A0ABQ3N1S1_9BACI|nr:stage II sporulation protein R [Neobacillus kokaensis]GHH97933.1 stage II sporulation protein R [Neobacillus kokaensis]